MSKSSDKQRAAVDDAFVTVKFDLQSVLEIQAVTFLLCITVENYAAIILQYTKDHNRGMHTAMHGMVRGAALK